MTTSTNETPPTIEVEINTAPVQENAVIETDAVADTAQEVAEVAIEIAVEAAEVAVETVEQVEDFELWARNQLTELTETLNLVAEIQVVQAGEIDKLSTSQQMSYTETSTQSSNELTDEAAEELTEVTAAQMDSAEVEPSDQPPEVVEETPLQNAAARLKSRIRIL